MNYKSLVEELFGTSNENELRQIASEYKRSKRTSLGRKKKFSKADVDNMLRLQKSGKTIEEISKIYGVTRQTVAKYISSKPSIEYPYVIDYMQEHTVLASVYVNLQDEKVKVINRTEDFMDTPFGVLESPTWDDFLEFLKYRCFPETRYDKNAILKSLDVPFYDPWLICQKTHGKITDDNYWLQFKKLEG